MKIRSALLASALFSGLWIANSQASTVIELSQTGCQFVESESDGDLGYRPQSAEDCKRINQQSAADRLQRAEPLTLKPGHYTFRVTNKNVPYALGFWLRGDGVLARATLPSVSGGGLTIGTSRDYSIELTPGEYIYSCPLNPTPDYRLIVE